MAAKKQSAKRLDSVKKASARATHKSRSHKKAAAQTQSNATPKKTAPKRFAWFGRVRQRMQFFLARRPHRSFRVTRRRDYRRSLRLPGYFAFTIEAGALLWRHKKTFLLMLAVFFVLIVLFGLMGSQEVYSQLKELLDETAPESLFSGPAGEVGKAGVILFTALTNGLSGRVDTGQVVLSSLFGLYIWLTMVWLLRRYVAGKQARLRDGLYNAGAPILPTMLLFVVLMLQLVPGALAVIVGATAWQTGLIGGGAAAMLLTVAFALIALLSLYWIVSTLVALVVVTLPGTYPMQALTISGDLVVGRRLRLVYRTVWLLLLVVSIWVVVMIPVILFDGWIKSLFEQVYWLPIVPMALLLVGIATVMYACSYVYLLYRKMVEDESAPA